MENEGTLQELARVAPEPTAGRRPPLSVGGRGVGWRRERAAMGVCYEATHLTFGYGKEK
jgi:hypothetical protein